MQDFFVFFVFFSYFSLKGFILTVEPSIAVTCTSLGLLWFLLLAVYLLSSFQQDVLVGGQLVEVKPDVVQDQVG